MTPGMWTVSITFALVGLVALALNAFPSYRVSRVATLGKSVGLAVPAELTAVLAARLTRRSLITWLGSLLGLAAVVVAVLLGLVTPSGDFSNASDIWLIAGGIVTGLAAGAIVNALTLTSVVPSGERFARSGAVEVSDYLAPIDLIGSRVAVAIGAAALAVWIGLATTGAIAAEPLVTVGVVVIALSGVSLVAFELATRRIRDRGQPVASPAELAWDDALRAMSMRSIASAPMCLGIWGALAICIDLATVATTDAAFATAVAAGVVVFVAIFIAAAVSIATKPQQHYLRRLWPEIASTPKAA